MNKYQSLHFRAIPPTALVFLLAVTACSATVRYVDLNSTNPVPPFTSWSTAALRIQDAVDTTNAPDEIIRIAPGDYYEQVVLAYKTNLTLAGEQGVVLHAFFPGMVESLKPFGWNWYPVLGVYRSDVVLTGLTIDGEHLSEFYTNTGGRLTRLLGIYLLGSSGNVSDCTVRGFRASALDTATDANALQALNRVDIGSPAVNVRVVNSTFLDNEVSVSLRGDPVNYPGTLRVTATIRGNTIIGPGPAPIFNAGVWIVTGVSGDVVGNTISGFAGTAKMHSSGIAAYDAGAQGRARFIPLFPLNFEGNAFTNNGQHLMLIGGNGSRVTNNKFLGNIEGALAWGAVALSGTNIVVSDNNFSDMPTGVLLVGYESWPTWPPIPPACKSSLIDNWFCNVPEQIRFDPTIVDGVQERGTETCPFTPRFKGFTRPSMGEARALLRAWHGDTVTLEASTNLVDWVPVHTHVMDLPTHECEDMNTDGVPQRFYRARQL